MERYSRHQDLIGDEGQQALASARVLVIGTGGLGSPTLFALAAAGVGTLGIVDDDEVELSNLNRQLLHSDEFLALPKTDSARSTIKRFNPDVELKTYAHRFDESLAMEIVPEYDMIIDCVDNYDTRIVASRYAARFGKTLIEAGIEGMSGFVLIVVPGKTACFNCFGIEDQHIYRQVLGASTGVIGNLQALECIKQLTGQWDGSYSYLAVDFEHCSMDHVLLEPRDGCECRTGPAAQSN